MTAAEAHEFINAVGDLLASWSLSRATGRIYGALLLEDYPVSLDHLADVVGLSKGQVSTSTRELTAWGLARAIPQPGSRRLLLEAVGGLDALLEASHRRARRFIDSLQEGRALVAQQPAARRRLDDVITLFDGYITAGEQILRGGAEPDAAGVPPLGLEPRLKRF